MHSLPRFLSFTSPQLIALLLLIVSLARGSETADPAEGFWVGTMRAGDDVTIYGLKIAREASGELSVAQYVPESNINGYRMGTLKADGERYTGAYKLMRRGDRLEGSFPDGGLPMTFYRADGPPPAQPHPQALKGPDEAWSFVSGSPLWGKPAVSGGRAFFGSVAGRFHAVEIASGREVWQRDLGAAMYGEAIVAGGVVYVSTDGGVLLALDQHTGDERWRAELGGGDVVRRPPARGRDTEFDYAAPAPLLEGSVIFIGSPDGGCHAIDSSTGKSLWRFKAKGAIRATALVVGDAVMFASRDRHLYALDRGTGQERWRRDLGGEIVNAPALVDGKLVIGHRGYRLLALHPEDGATAWEKFQWFSWVDSTATVADGVIYIGSSDLRKVRALEPATGATRWETNLGGWAWAQPVVDGDTVYAGAVGLEDPLNYVYPAEGCIAAIDRETGVVKWRIPAPKKAGEYLSGYGASPVRADCVLLAAGLDGVLRALRP